MYIRFEAKDDKNETIHVTAHLSDGPWLDRGQIFTEVEVHYHPDQFEDCSQCKEALGG